MKIYTGIRDAKRMKLAELEAINKQILKVEANDREGSRSDFTGEIPTYKAQESSENARETPEEEKKEGTTKEAQDTKKARKKKN